jgi:hypothetical protein
MFCCIKFLKEKHEVIHLEPIGTMDTTNNQKNNNNNLKRPFNKVGPIMNWQLEGGPDGHHTFLA